MATLTSSAIGAAVPWRQVHAGLQVKHVRFHPGTVSLSVSATTIYMMKIPHGAVVYDITADLSSGAATAPTDFGRVGSLDEFGSGTLSTIFRATKGLPYTVSGGANGYEIFTATPTVGTLTASYTCDMWITYAMDNETP